MTTPHVLSQLPFWVEGDLTPAEMATVETHLAQCLACREAAEHLRISQAWMREVMASPFEPSDQERMRREVMEEIHAEAKANPIQWFAVRRGLLAACAASLLIAILIWHQERRGGVKPPTLLEPPPRTLERNPQPGPSHGLPLPQAVPPPHARIARRQEVESPPPGEPTRIEFQTSDPNIRIIWLAQAKPLPEANPSQPEEP